MKNPCYDEVMNKSCSQRHCGCSITCVEWKKYVEERNKKYENKNKLNHYVTYAYEIERSQKIRKHCQKYNPNLGKFWR